MILYNSSYIMVFCINHVVKNCLNICQWQPYDKSYGAWWCHQTETFSALLALCAGNSPVADEFPAQRPVTRSFDVFFDLRLNERLSKQPWGWWSETPPRSLWRQCNGVQRPVMDSFLKNFPLKTFAYRNRCKCYRISLVALKPGHLKM